MIGGFALVAYPAKWGDSGIMTFIVNQDGVVYQKNLGPRTASLARQITEYDPDPVGLSSSHSNNRRWRAYPPAGRVLNG